MRTLSVVLVAIATLLLTGPSLGGTCYTTSTATQAGAFYIVHDCPTCLDVWIYQESNNIAGLQRNDSAHSDVSHCVDIASDTLVL